MRRRFWRVLTLALFFSALLLFAGSLLLWQYYWSNRPRVAQNESGMIYALNYHGIPVYISEAEYFWLHFMEGTGVTFLIASISILVFVLKQKRLEDLR